MLRSRQMPPHLVVMLLWAALVLAGCAHDTTTAPLPTSSTSPTPTSTGIPIPSTTATSTTTAPPTTTTAKAGLGTPLTPRQLAGQRVIYSYAGLTPPRRLLDLVGRGEAAGVIFFADNISSREQLRRVTRMFERAATGAGNPIRAPLLFMVDQEGGGIRRLPGAPVLSAKQIGAASDATSEAAKAGAAAALNLRRAGVNVNLAPVLDVYRTTGDFADQNGRSYSRDPDSVSTLGAAFIRAQQDAGVAATAKHFPGLGAAIRTQNTDLHSVTLRVSRATLEGVDEAPYPRAIAAGVHLVMVSWAVYPALDPSRPAGFSTVVVRDLLRGELGFRGVTVTDALEAGALQAFGHTPRRAVLAAEAGMDLILCSAREVSQGEQARLALERAYGDGTLAPASFRSAVGRIIDLRSELSEQ